MKNPVKTYQFWFKIISAALLISLGIWLLVDQQSAKFIVLMFTGILAAVFAVIRVIPLIRTLKNPNAKWICFAEIIVHLLLSVYLIFAAMNLRGDPDSSFAQFNDKNYRFFVAFLLYSRAVVYFICTVLYKEETDQIKFWVHIIFITLSSFICAVDNITSMQIAITIAVIAFICSLFLIGDGGMGYWRYRKSIEKERTSSKEEQPQKEEGVQLPNPEVVIPMIDEEEKDQNQIVN